MLAVLAELKVPVALEKVCRPSRRQEVLGITIDADACTFEVREAHVDWTTQVAREILRSLWDLFKTLRRHGKGRVWLSRLARDDLQWWLQALRRQHRWTAEEKAWDSMPRKELFPVIEVARRLGPCLRGKVLLAATDSITNAYAINAGSSSSPEGTALLKELAELEREHDFETVCGAACGSSSGVEGLVRRRRSSSALCVSRGGNAFRRYRLV
mmetsp:Transcript_12091/g.24316  ORF Transcript_12091/g.24316 Transcript_12091/m.24316 type:complete len:213 (+) Transcript_12091:1115-1753(+)